MTEVTISDVTLCYGPVTALRGFTLRVEPGEFMVLVGASGSGKTSVLRAIAGLEQPVAGDIVLGSRSVFSSTHQIDVPPAKRGVGMVFQSHALYPHMTVAQNVGFPLSTRHWPKPRQSPAIAAALETVELAGFEERLPRELSGGQRQRVALARALISQPSLLLFDEPLSSVDAKLRVSLRADLKRLQRRIGATSIYVTHDIAEAMALGDRITVVSEGTVQQVGLPTQVYAAPETLAVAALFRARGSSQIPGVVADTKDGRQVVRLERDAHRELPIPANRSTYSGQPVVVNIRAQDVAIAAGGDAAGGDAAGGDAAATAGFPVTVTARHPHGERDWATVRAHGSDYEIVARGAAQRHLELGQEVRVSVAAGNVYDAGTERLLVSSSGPTETAEHPPADGGRSALAGARS